jgi:hypothetical protein
MAGAEEGGRDTGPKTGAAEGYVAVDRVEARVKNSQERRRRVNTVDVEMALKSVEKGRAMR